MSRVHAVGLFIIGIAALAGSLIAFYYFSGMLNEWALVPQGSIEALEIYTIMGGHTFMALLVVWPLFTFWISTMRSAYWGDDNDS